MEFISILIPAIVLIGLCFLGMAVGVIFRDKSFKSCGCATITFNGERIDCPGHVPEKDDAEPGCEHRATCSKRSCEKEASPQPCS